MQKKETNGLTWLEFDLLADMPGLKHGIFLRHGGCSTGATQSLNVSFDVGDNFSHVESNIGKIKQTLGIEDLVWSQQCHGKTILNVTEPSFPLTSSCDAFCTKELGIGLMIKHADCQAAILYDPIHHVVANVHSGWRGSVLNIYKETILFMQKTFGTKPSDLLVGISPSLGPASAEFINYKKELPSEFMPFQVKTNYFDFWEISRYQLEKCGVLPHHIEIARIDTYANPQDYFSFRRDKITGRHGTIVSLY